MHPCRTLKTVRGRDEALSTCLAVVIFSDNSKRRGRGRRKREGGERRKEKEKAERVRSRGDKNVMGRVQEPWGAGLRHSSETNTLGGPCQSPPVLS